MYRGRRDSSGISNLSSETFKSISVHICVKIGNFCAHVIYKSVGHRVYRDMTIGREAEYHRREWYQEVRINMFRWPNSSTGSEVKESLHSWYYIRSSGQKIEYSKHLAISWLEMVCADSQPHLWILAGIWFLVFFCGTLMYDMCLSCSAIVPSPAYCFVFRFSENMHFRAYFRKLFGCYDPALIWMTTVA